MPLLLLLLFLNTLYYIKVSNLLMSPLSSLLCCQKHSLSMIFLASRLPPFVYPIFRPGGQFLEFRCCCSSRQEKKSFR